MPAITPAAVLRSVPAKAIGAKIVKEMRGHAFAVGISQVLVGQTLAIKEAVQPFTGPNLLVHLGKGIQAHLEDLELISGTDLEHCCCTTK